MAASSVDVSEPNFQPDFTQEAPFNLDIASELYLEEATIQPHPLEQKNFHHLVMDIFWFGLALPATARFASVYAIRLEATPEQIGWLAALPALILLVSAFFAQWWSKFHVDSARASFMPGLLFRFSFFLPFFAPFFMGEWRGWWVVFALSLPALPQGVSTVMFLMMMREAVGPKRLTQLVSRRHVAMNIALGIGTLILGVWLTRIAFPLNYQLMYLAAFGITLISLWHVRQTRSIYIEPVRDTRFTDNILPWRDRAFHRVIWLTVLTHIGFFMIFPFISLYLVDYRGANEEFVGLFVLIELVGGAFIATQLPRFAAQYGHFNMLPLGMVGLAISSLAIILAPSLPLTLFGSLLNGIFWTMVNVGLYGYYNEKLSPKNLTAYTVCYSQSVFGATFIGSLLSSQLFRLDLGIVAILLIGTVVRLLIGMGIGLAGWSQAFRGFWHTWSVALSNTPNWIERVHHRH